ncbi:MAG: L,D-transpeptidase [Pseudomonadota bacterium]
MKAAISMVAALSLALVCTNAIAAKRYGEKLCNNPHYTCYRVKSGDSWSNLFANQEKQDIVKRVNRMNVRLRPGIVIAIPKTLDSINHFDVAPFPLQIDPRGEKWVRVDLRTLAWAAYDEKGHMVHWGPVSGGRKWCNDIGAPCRTATGNYRVVRKQDYNCTSSVFPLPFGGAAMPFCMHYYRAFALHGSFDVPGYNDSHGCVRMFINDARWLNEHFVDNYTKVSVQAD